MSSKYETENSTSEHCVAVNNLIEEGFLEEDDDEATSEVHQEESKRLRFIKKRAPIELFHAEAVQNLTTEKQNILTEHSEELFNSNLTYQEQIELVISLIYDPKGGNKAGPTTLGMLFGISKGSMNTHIKRMQAGHKAVGRPSILTREHLELISYHINKKFM